jgi:hypothetical protein
MTSSSGALAAFASGIRFRWIQPGQALVPWHLTLRHQLGRLRCPLDLVIARLPDGGLRLRRLLRPLCTIPRMSTFAIAAILNRAVSLMPADTAFVNVGVWHGFTFLAGMAGNAARRCVGVDNFSEFGDPKDAFLARFDRRKSPSHSFYEMDYADYFAKRHDGPIGVYLYDGEHGYENQRRGLETAEHFFAPGCVILVDDTNLPEPRRATLDFMAAHPGRYRILLDRTTCANGHPTFWNGLLVIQRAA